MIKNIKNLSTNNKIDLFDFFIKILPRKRIFFFIIFLSFIIPLAYEFATKKKFLYTAQIPILSYVTVSEKFPTRIDQDNLNKDFFLLLENKSFFISFWNQSNDFEVAKLFLRNNNITPNNAFDIVARDKYVYFECVEQIDCIKILNNFFIFTKTFIVNRTVENQKLILIDYINKLKIIADLHLKNNGDNSISSVKNYFFETREFVSFTPAEIKNVIDFHKILLNKINSDIYKLDESPYNQIKIVSTKNKLQSLLKFSFNFIILVFVFFFLLFIYKKNNI
jgi:hypothetical protein